ncbi:hypothetical protein PC116_g9351 [Phytophthora cactorum]|uniref:Uncharacterized protein n=2 Tax=Phytophthora cactorum TaxID=29920 RepID=A0A329SZ83_9STRA|nr:hypothetical protein PC112_g6512 [Phytophthora cactorum]KAG4242772.1 hypothetical protein PC116_g9351 [Phytophthora cactorum]RAW41278.1 hypothetical protein PC110_g2528 [Phytophthora cactorum]
MMDLSVRLENLRTPFDRRSTIRSASMASVSRATVQWRVSSGELVAATTTVKPLLTDENKTERLDWCIMHVQPVFLLFNDMYDTIHVDEKLLYLTAVRRRYYLLPGEEAPHHQARSRRYITKDVDRVTPPSYTRTMALSVHLRVQQDNEPAHIAATDAALVAATLQQGLDVELCCQPQTSASSRPSKHVNVCDLLAT